MLGYDIASLGDLNNDGLTDIIVSSVTDSEVATNAGAAYVLFLTDSGTVKSYKKIRHNLNGFEGMQRGGDYFGGGLEGGYDIDLDGVNDILVSALGADFAGLDRGILWILFMNADGTVKNHHSISSSSSMFTGLLEDQDQIGNSIAVLDYDLIHNKMKIAVGVMKDDDGATDAGAVYIVEIDLSVLKDYSNNIIINTIPFSDNIPYQLNLQGLSTEYTTGGLETLLVNNLTTTDTAKITVTGTNTYGALELLFDVTEVQISNVRIITDSLGGGDTLALDTNLYIISNDLHTLTLFQKDTNEIITDSLLFGFDLQGGLGFTPNGDGDYDVLTINGLANIYYFNLTIKDLENTTVFYTEDKTDFWDGKYMGTESLVSKGSYKYILNVNGETLEGQILLDY